MLECLVLLTLIGLLLASQRKMGLANPFQVYFSVWFSVFFGYYVFSDFFIKVSFEFLYLMLTAKVVALLLLIVVILKPAAQIKSRNMRNLAFDIWPEERFVFFAQIIVFVALPLVYGRAVQLADGSSIFSVLGYIKLRTAMTEEGRGYGYLAYLFTLAFVVTSLQLNLVFKKIIRLPYFIFSVVISLFYAYLGTGRTFILLFAVLMLFPLIIMGIIRFRGLFISIALIAFLFVFVAAMTAKGVSVDESFSSNVKSFLENLAGYTVAPILAFFRLMSTKVEVDFGANSFRILYSLLYSFGLFGFPPVALVRDYAFVPGPTNVYTVYEVYFRDFSYLGVVVPPLFLIGHWWLYAKARRFGGVWIFYYSVSVYPLLMQFFQDQYFSLLSTWIQIGFWYWLLMKNSNKKRINKLINYA